jgi:hypothetical protein
MSPSENAETEVVKLLTAAAKPMTFAQLKAAAHLEEAALRSVLEATTSQGLVFRWPDLRRAQYFWSQSPDQAAQQEILTITSELALSRTNLITRVRKKVRGFPPQAVARIVGNLISDQRLQQVPAFSSGKLLIHSGSAAAYAAAARAFIEEKFRKAGFDPAQFFTPESPVGDAAEMILEAVRALEPVTGVPVSTQRLRDHLSSLSKIEFDTAALELRKKQQVFLSLHHDPHNLPSHERELLIDGGDGTYYVAIAIR